MSWRRFAGREGAYLAASLAAGLTRVATTVGLSALHGAPVAPFLSDNMPGSQPEFLSRHALALAAYLAMTAVFYGCLCRCKQWNMEGGFERAFFICWITGALTSLNLTVVSLLVGKTASQTAFVFRWLLCFVAMLWLFLRLGPSADRRHAERRREKEEISRAMEGN